MNVKDALKLIEDEHQQAISHYPPFASAHEGFAVLLEEVTELQAEIFKNYKLRDYDAIRKESIQVAAMALRLLIEVSPKANSIETQVELGS